MDQADAQFHFVLNQSTNNIPALLGKLHTIKNDLSWLHFIHQSTHSIIVQQVKPVSPSIKRITEEL